MYQSGRPVELLERQLAVRAGKTFVAAYTSCFYDLKVLRPCTVPPTGGAIIVSNHLSSLDPVLLQAACPRMITWMMAREYASSPALQWFFRAIEPIMVERSGKDLAATRDALRALEAGKVLGIFPEGKWETSRQLLPFRAGIGLLALKSGAPVYPACVEGDQRGKDVVEAFLVPGQATVTFGLPLHFARGQSRLGVDEITHQIQQAVAALAPK